MVSQHVAVYTAEVTVLPYQPHSLRSDFANHFLRRRSNLVPIVFHQPCTHWIKAASSGLLLRLKYIRANNPVGAHEGSL